jgi:DNA-binding NarL/FixJ family response regulator
MASWRGAAAFSALYKLSEQESRLLSLAVDGHTNHEAAEVLGCAMSTVRTYWSRIFRKVGCRSERNVVVRLLWFRIYAERKPKRFGV